MASAESNSSILTSPECYVLSDSTQCCTEQNEAPPTEMVIATNKMMIEQDDDDDDEQAELVIGKELLIPIHLINSELVV